MKKIFSDLQLKQIDERLRPARTLLSARPPRAGWVRTIRQALGMTQPQLAARLGITRQSVADLERAEASGKITLESLHRLAEAMSCRVVYAIVPKEASLNEIRIKRARDIADAHLKSVAHSMRLEAQDVSEKESARQRAQLMEDLLRGSSRKLWR